MPHVVKMVQDWWKNLRDQFVTKTQKSGTGGEGVDEIAEYWKFYVIYGNIKWIEMAWDHVTCFKL